LAGTRREFADQSQDVAVSGPVDRKDVPEDQDQRWSPRPVVLVNESRAADVGSMRVRRALPNRHRRTVGAWCFADHFGPLELSEQQRADVGPHPHMGLQTVTWLLDGELVHRDSLGSEQVIRPGQLNLMTAGWGVAHAEESPGFRGEIHGVQLWVAQPSATRNGNPDFEHDAQLPRVELENCDAIVLVGELATTRSAPRRDTEHVGVDLAIRGPTVVPVQPTFEYALVVTKGAVVAGGQTVTPGHLAYLGAGRDELGLETTEYSRVLLLGGTPFREELLMWWNFVARTRAEVEAGYQDWAAGSGRFGLVASALPRMETGPPFWLSRRD
jgi:quercetin 2,3-dioxygenase